MNNFFKNFGDSLREEFKIEVEDFISKKKETCAYVFGEATDIVHIFQGNN